MTSHVSKFEIYFIVSYLHSQKRVDDYLPPKLSFTALIFNLLIQGNLGTELSLDVIEADERWTDSSNTSAT